MPRCQFMMIALVGLAVVCLTVSVCVMLVVATSVAWGRSYRVADCWIRTTAERTDSAYLARGAIVLNWMTSIGQPGWSQERDDPRALPKSMAESGDLARWNVFGIEYSSLSQMLIVPMWTVMGLSVICGMLMVRTLRSLARGGRNRMISAPVS